MNPTRSVAASTAVLVLLLAPVACGGGDETPPAAESEAPAEDPSGAEESLGDVWFSIDESAGTVTHEDGTYPIAVRGTLIVDGQEYEFVGNRCPIPESGTADDVDNFHAYGFAPDGRPFNFNSALDLSFNITYDRDWRSTNTMFDAFGPDWNVVSADEMRIDELEVEDTETGEMLPASIVVTCP